MTGSTNPIESAFLIAQFDAVSREISSRYTERYKLHALTLGGLGLLGTFFGVAPTIIATDVKVLVLSFLPLFSTAVMALMLKEHQYINMRDRYLETVLYLHLEGLAGQSFSWPVWQKFEHVQMGRQQALPRRKTRMVVFALLGAFDYALPAIAAAASLAMYFAVFRRTAYLRADLRRFADVFAVLGLILFVLVVVMVVWLRLREQEWFPRESVAPDVHGSTAERSSLASRGRRVALESIDDYMKELQRLMAENKGRFRREFLQVARDHVAKRLEETGSP